MGTTREFIDEEFVDESCQLLPARRSTMTNTPAAAPIPGFDATRGRFYDDPWETYRWLRDNDPVYWDAANELWVLSRYEDVSHVSRHPEMYSSKFGVRPRMDTSRSSRWTTRNTPASAD